MLVVILAKVDGHDESRRSFELHSGTHRGLNQDCSLFSAVHFQRNNGQFYANGRLHGRKFQK